MKNALFFTGAVMLAASNALAQDLSRVQPPSEPLVLQSRGSFLIGGDEVERSGGQLSSIFGDPLPEGGPIIVNQTYVEYMVPQNVSGVPVVMLHGATLSGKTYDTTPDGRMGWYEYFVRQGHPTYVPDQVSRGRSGFDPSIFNDVRTGRVPPSELPAIFQQNQKINWTTFRFGPEPGTAWNDGKFPVDAARELARQATPDLNAILPDPNPNWAAMAELGRQLEGAVLMGHSETGAVPIRAALTDAAGAAGLILVEPGLCYATRLSDAEIATLAEIPILAVFGDHLGTETGMHGFTWQNAYDDCIAFVTRVNAAGGNAAMLYPPDLGINGNSHMIMQDRNNLEIADLILTWIDENIPAGGQ